ncbi:S-layer homology domain-containing protein [Natronincola peptidivorans]|uniref:S-layer homology domain-containing protein n=1 Tax=Natronincola peptidivorans TaxID=426128 RepID=A0A1I0EHV0_9FIRM|nr:S-layer homology domain-containing protein [Natronincola peptidivorans]SET44924.1 S-layer homology domain-containing protein [Natronincola peptidivorans]
MKKRISLLLIHTMLISLLTMLMSLLPTSVPVLAAERHIPLGVVESVYGRNTTSQFIYFGKNKGTDPIKWRVMVVEDDKATLMSEYILEYIRYEISDNRNWSNAEICKYLNRQYSFASGGFLTTAFSSVEQAKILVYSNTEESGYNSPGTFTPNQKIVLPSLDEVKDGGTFGMNESDRAALEAEGFLGTPNTEMYKKTWWLRTPGEQNDSALSVRSSGSIDYHGNYVGDKLGIRPAFKLNLADVLFTSDASGNGVKTGTPNSMLNRVVHTNNEKKLTLIDSNQGLVSAATTSKYIQREDTEIEINYQGAITGTNQYLSAMITDNRGVLKYYGTIKSLANSEDGSGTAEVTIPRDFEDGWKLKIFTEQLNGDYQTDYASVPVEVTLTAKWKQNSSGGGSSSSGRSSSEGGTSTLSLNAEQVINRLSKDDKVAIINLFKEYMPYTFFSTDLTLEQLKVFTNNKFTDKQLQEILDNPQLLQKLGIDDSMMSRTVFLKPIHNPSFTDVKSDHWAYGSIIEAASLGLVTGMPDGSFAPNNPLQVADTFVFLDKVLLLNNITEPKLPRSTVELYINDKNHWAFNHMASIKSKLSEETLMTISQLGDAPITRELLAQILYEITKGRLEATREVRHFTDIQSSSYKEAIDYCVSRRLLSGTSSTTMSPQKSLTRGELMSVLIKLESMLK